MVEVRVIPAYQPRIDNREVEKRSRGDEERLGRREKSRAEQRGWALHSGLQNDLSSIQVWTDID
jgi:hypothetical protein